MLLQLLFHRAAGIQVEGCLHEVGQHFNDMRLDAVLRISSANSTPIDAVYL